MLIAIIALSFIFPAIWLWIFLKEDPHPEPPAWIVLAFFTGIISTLCAFLAESWFVTLETDLWVYIFFASFVEEFYKFFFVAIVIFRSRVFDEPIDAMVYLIVAALGFAAFENISIVAEYASKTFPSVATLAFIRFLGANFLHAVASALVGYSWALAVASRRLGIFLTGFFSAVTLHAFYNFFIMSRETTFYVAPLLWAAALMVLHDFDLLKRSSKRTLRYGNPKF